MKKALALALLACTVVVPAHARDTELKLPFEEVLQMPEAKEKLDGSVKFFLAGQKTPKVLEKKGGDKTSKKTNGFGKEDDVACRWAALSALIALQDRAKAQGANAVIDIVSYHKHEVFSSPTEYECHAGNIVVGVTLKGTYAKIAN